MNIFALLLAFAAFIVFAIEVGRTYRSDGLHRVALGLALLTLAWILQQILTNLHQYHAS